MRASDRINGVTQPLSHKRKELGTMLRKLPLILALVGLFSLAAAPAVSAAPGGSGTATTSPIQIVDAPCTIAGTGDPSGLFDGTFTLTRFVSSAGDLFARGTLVGECVTDTANRLVNQVVNIPITGGAASAACEILELDLGPLNLDVLGLVIDLSAISLDITAVPGPGNLLGNLLCAVAGLLDGNATGALANLLNQLLGLLG